MKISADKETAILTYALGSCLGITVHDQIAGVGGLLHVMLPLSTIDPAKAVQNPYMFVDTGLPRLFLDCYKLGAKKERMVVKVAGGASGRKVEAEDMFQIGKRNFLMLRKLLWKNNVLLKAHDVGGSISRHHALDVGSGRVVIRANGEARRLRRQRAGEETGDRTGGP